MRAAVAAAALALVLTACGGTEERATTLPTSPAGTPKLEPNATVERTVDGDTLVAEVQGRRERVRLIGIDTPESVDPRRPVECFGKEASKHLAALLPAGTSVRLVRDAELRDRYGRLLAYVYRSQDGAFVNLAMVEGGFANAYTFPPNVAHAESFRAAAAAARAAGRGLWGRC